jgi:hypothetical protein
MLAIGAPVDEFEFLDELRDGERKIAGLLSFEVLVNSAAFMDDPNSAGAVVSENPRAASFVSVALAHVWSRSIGARV